MLNERIRVLDLHDVRIKKCLPIFGLNKKVPGGVQLVPEVGVALSDLVMPDFLLKNRLTQCNLVPYGVFHHAVCTFD